jgi:imidazolonepropionase-like amidohydrolase
MNRSFKLLVASSVVVTSMVAAASRQAQDGPIDLMGPFLASESTSFLLENARVVDGTSAVAREGWSLVIESGLISAVGPSEEIVAPHGSERIDLAGHTVLPGLIMMHESLSYASGNAGSDPLDAVNEVLDAHPNSIPKLLLAAGVTTARTFGSLTLQVDLSLKRRIDTGAAVGPTLFVTGPVLSGPRAPWLGDFVIESPEEAREVVRFWVGQGTTSVSVTDLSPEALEATIEEAHRLGIQVAGDFGFGASCLRPAELGIDTIERGFASCMQDIPQAWLANPSEIDLRAPEVTTLIDSLVGNGVVLVYTPLAWPPTDEELPMLSVDQLARHKDVLASPPPLLADSVPELGALNREAQIAFVARGGTLLLGADASGLGRVPGYANHAAMIGVSGTFSPLEVIRMATSDAAAFLGIGDRTGRLAAGLEADLLVVSGVPDVDMRDVRNVVYVFKDGRAFDPQKLREAAKGLVGLH